MFSIDSCKSLVTILFSHSFTGYCQFFCLRCLSRWDSFHGWSTVETTINTRTICHHAGPSLRVVVQTIRVLKSTFSSCKIYTQMFFNYNPEKFIMCVLTSSWKISIISNRNHKKKCTFYKRPRHFCYDKFIYNSNPCQTVSQSVDWTWNTIKRMLE